MIFLFYFSCFFILKQTHKTSQEQWTEDQQAWIDLYAVATGMKSKAVAQQRKWVPDGHTDFTDDKKRTKYEGSGRGEGEANLRRHRNDRTARRLYSLRVFSSVRFDTSWDKPVSILNRNYEKWPIAGVVAPAMNRSFAHSQAGEGPHVDFCWGTDGRWRRPLITPQASKAQQPPSKPAALPVVPVSSVPEGLQPKSCIPPPRASVQSGGSSSSTTPPPWKAAPGEPPVPYMGFFKAPPPKKPE